LQSDCEKLSSYDNGLKNLLKVGVENCYWSLRYNEKLNKLKEEIIMDELSLGLSPRLVTFMMNNIRKIRNGDEITSPSRRIDLGQICSISNHKS